jgi:hypothetical protein
MERSDDAPLDPPAAATPAPPSEAEVAASKASAEAEALEDERAAAESKVAIQKAARAVLVCAAVITGVSALAFDLHTGIGALVGGVIATLNLLLFARLVRAFIAQKGTSAPWGVLGALKLIGLFACVWILVRRGEVSAIGLALGYASLPIGITFATLFKAPPAPLPRR